MTQPENLSEAIAYFGDSDACEKAMIALKWPDGKIVCPKCGGGQIGVIRTRSIMRCMGAACRKQFSAKAGTIFGDSVLPFSKWFVVAWCIADGEITVGNAKLARILGVGPNTVYLMRHRILLAMETPTFRRLPRRASNRKRAFGGARFYSLLAKLARVPKREMVNLARERGGTAQMYRLRPSE
jgi:transposase-like protein